MRRELLLGLIQGPAELLPVSSSAHARLLGADDKAEQVALHAGSAVAALATRPPIRPWFAALATAPPAVAVLVAQERIERLGPRAIAAGLLAGSAALWMAPHRGTRAAADARPADALAIGAGQAAALWPGVSRSAATLVAARVRGFSPQAAYSLSRESWLPVLLAATARMVPRLRPHHLPEAAVAAASTAVALRLLGPPRRLRAFAAYRTGLAIWTVWEDRR